MVIHSFLSSSLLVLLELYLSQTDWWEIIPPFSLLSLFAPPNTFPNAFYALGFEYIVVRFDNIFYLGRSGLSLTVNLVDEYPKKSNDGDLLFSAWSLFQLVNICCYLMVCASSSLSFFSLTCSGWNEPISCCWFWEFLSCSFTVRNVTFFSYS